MSDADCPIGNHCKDVFDESNYPRTRCVPRDDLDDRYYCSLSLKSCKNKHKIFLKSSSNCFIFF